MSWKRIIRIPQIILANGYSWLTYQISGYPSDKQSYRQFLWNWLTPDMEQHWKDAEEAEWSFHELKNVGVEYARLHAQPAMKSLCMFLVLGWVLWVISTLALVLSFLF